MAESLFQDGHVHAATRSMLIAFSLVSALPQARAQAVQTPSVVASAEIPDNLATLPDSPGAVAAASSSSQPDELQISGPAPRQYLAGHPVERSTVAPVTHKLILPEEIAPPLTARDKVRLGLIHGVSPFSVTGWVLAAGYEQVTDGTPNYGTDSGAYGQRLAAAAVRGYSESVIGTSILAPILHEDPRYYRVGSQHGYFYRTVYAATRPIISRSDDGHSRPNLSLIAGNLIGSALTNAYYPSRNRGFHQTMDTFEGSMGGAAFSFLLDEYVGELLQAAHLRHFHE